MTPLSYIRPILAIFLLLLSGFGLWYLYHSGYKAGKNEIQVQWDADKIKRDEAEKNALLAYANHLKEGQIQHDQDQIIINKLRDAGRMRVHLPTASTCAGHDENVSPGIFSTRVDESFTKLQDRAIKLFQECDQLNIDARQVNKSLH